MCAYFLFLSFQFLFQVLTYKGFYDTNLEWVGLEGVQIVASMTAGSGLDVTSYLAGSRLSYEFVLSSMFELFFFVQNLKRC